MGVSGRGGAGWWVGGEGWGGRGGGGEWKGCGRCALEAVRGTPRPRGSQPGAGGAGQIENFAREERGGNWEVCVVGGGGTLEGGGLHCRRWQGR